MCDTCNCGEGNPVLRRPGDAHDEGHHPHGHLHDHDHHGHEHHDHDHDHDHEGHERHGHGHGKSGRKVRVEADVLGANNRLAAENRARLRARGITALNLMSSPGSGKTTLLEKSLRILKEERPVAVIEGDQQTVRDAERIEATGVPVIQVNTGAGCHLDASMVARAVEALAVADGSLLLIENVGNLVCPAMFDLGEEVKVVILSVSEGDDKPLKYPAMFRAASVCVISKTDLLPYVDFDLGACKRYAAGINPGLRFFELSARTGEGMEQWLDWLRENSGE